ncbi:hypothetical protein LJ656_27370 [Paraburkholderia sp. MMS20-SJTR3]|uniref:Uncharacterized protein n=1 Tax=Paraburkholderia sejongensis TaxID=2886946 RepID=A0ABS8K2U7_9BURK|nr:hypothetical protein [Paraburkholderia sp. MMS20-SJTR3]MCC8396315.1 hypothetical protein [Paraburkholderia sp. MMS20-SJTR3]
MVNRTDIAPRAAAEMNAAAKALTQANALFVVLGKMGSGSIDLTEAVLLAQIGAELTANYGDRAADEADFFAEVRHG